MMGIDTVLGDVRGLLEVTDGREVLLELHVEGAPFDQGIRLLEGGGRGGADHPVQIGKRLLASTCKW